MLKEHMRVHDNIREYLCAECGKGTCGGRRGHGAEGQGVGARPWRRGSGRRRRGHGAEGQGVGTGAMAQRVRA